MKKNTKIIIIIAIVVVIAVVAFVVIRKKSSGSSESNAEDQGAVSEASSRSAAATDPLSKIKKDSIKNVLGRISYYQNNADTKSLSEAEIIKKSVYDSYTAKSIDWNGYQEIAKGNYTVAQLKQAVS